jgi:exonuclease SbcC
LAELKIKIERLNRLVEAESLFGDRKEKEKLLSMVERTISDLNFDDKFLSDAESDATRLREQLAEDRAVIEGLEQRLKDKGKLVEEFKRQRLVFDNKLAKIEELEARTRKLVEFEALITGIQADLREELVQAVNEVLEMVWKSVYPYGDYSSAVVVTADNDYSLKLKNEVLIDVDEASGGERACAAISLRIALAVALVPNLKWIILDEPTHNLDSSAVSMLSTSLKEGFSAIASQVFIITHDEALKSGFDSYYSFDRRKDENGSTVVEKITAF